MQHVDPTTTLHQPDHESAPDCDEMLEPLDQNDPFAAEDGSTSDAARRRIVLTAASSISPRPVTWLFTGRVAVGEFTLLAGREGIGKSTLAYQLAADITRGLLEGSCYGKPRAVFVAATEDSWEHTIVPRLMAAGADLDVVFRVDVMDAGLEMELKLPRDVQALRDHVAEHHPALILLDPLTSRLDGTLDTHKDSSVRQALEPLVKLAHDTAVAIIGLIHVNKGMTSDPLNAVMGSRAFTAVARAVIFVMKDPDDEDVRLVGVPKNNLGRTDLPTLTFTIESAVVAETAEGRVETGRLVWGPEDERDLHEVMEAAGGTDSRHQTKVKGAVAWLTTFLIDAGGSAYSQDIKTAAGVAGYSKTTLTRAREDAGIDSRTTSESPPRTIWELPVGRAYRKLKPAPLPGLVGSLGSLGSAGPFGLPGVLDSPNVDAGLASSTAFGGIPLQATQATQAARATQPAGPWYRDEA